MEPISTRVPLKVPENGNVSKDEIVLPGPVVSWRELFFRYVPAFDSLRTYSRTAFRRDVVAGLTVAAVAIPQAMAYATIAGLPPQLGLYTAIVMTAVGALLDPTGKLINGPTNAISIALFSALALGGSVYLFHRLWREAILYARVEQGRHRTTAAEGSHAFRRSQARRLQPARRAGRSAQK